MCYFDLVTNIYGLPSGTYTISVYNADGEYVGGGEAVIPSPTFILPTSGEIMKEKPSLQERK